VIGLSVTMSFNMPALREAVPRLRAVTSAPIFVGGHAIDLSRTTAVALGVEIVGNLPDELLATARRLAGIGKLGPDTRGPDTRGPDTRGPETRSE